MRILLKNKSVTNTLQGLHAKTIIDRKHVFSKDIFSDLLESETLDRRFVKEYLEALISANFKRFPSEFAVATMLSDRLLEYKSKIQSDYDGDGARIYLHNAMAMVLATNSIMLGAVSILSKYFELPGVITHEIAEGLADSMLNVRSTFIAKRVPLLAHVLRNYAETQPGIYMIGNPASNNSLFDSSGQPKATKAIYEMCRSYVTQTDVIDLSDVQNVILCYDGSKVKGLISDDHAGFNWRINYSNSPVQVCSLMLEKPQNYVMDPDLAGLSSILKKTAHNPNVSSYETQASSLQCRAIELIFGEGTIHQMTNAQVKTLTAANTYPYIATCDVNTML